LLETDVSDVYPLPARTGTDRNCRASALEGDSVKQRRFATFLALATLLASLGVLVAPVAATAGVPPPPEPVPVPAVVPPPAEPVINPTFGPPGTVIAVTVPGCTGVVTAALGNESADVLAFNEGPGPTISLTVPEGTPQGEIVVVAGCDAYTENDFDFTVFTVTAAATVVQPRFTG
jgi:hypothetical protein